MAQLAGDIRGVMIPVTEAKVLLPNASVSEVITYGNPQPIDDAPDWVFGVITWRGWRIPLYSFSLLTGQAEKENFSGAKVAIIKALAGEGDMPFMALLAQGFPRLTAVTKENLSLLGDQDEIPPGVKHVVTVNDDKAFVPDLDGIEKRLMEVLGVREPDPAGFEQSAFAASAKAEETVELDADLDEFEAELQQSEPEPDVRDDETIEFEPAIAFDEDALSEADDDDSLISFEGAELEVDDQNEDEGIEAYEYDPLMTLDADSEEDDPLELLDVDLEVGDSMSGLDEEDDDALELLNDSVPSKDETLDVLSDESDDEDDDFDFDFDVGIDDDI